MAWYPDLAALDYFGAEYAATLRAVGWLSRSESFPTGSVAPPVFQRLTELLSGAWQPFVCVGVFGCELCRFSPEAQSTNNLFIPDGESVYVCPALITHYMNAHQYQPPAEFCAAVLACPSTRSMEYKRLLLRSGLRLSSPKR